ncbi:MAG: AfsR/SARP family transcriptional regulator [Actinomycetota bacterium]|nr:AfsR/SARP family transcriptional regulator [Actinomycetota bacterium]
MEFRILGPLEVRREGRPVHIGGAKERTLLALLLLHAGEPVSADHLIDELWGDSPPATARKSLQVRVVGLRRALRGDALLTRGNGYLLRLEPKQLDLHRFEQLLSEGRDALAASDPSAAVSTLDEALALWRGPALADFTYDSFAQSASARMEELRVRALELRIEAQLELGLHAQVIVELEDLVAAHPFRERLRGQLMLALYRDGRQAEALDVYRRTREKLVAELGIEPGPVLHELQQGVLRQDPSLAGPLAAPERSVLVAPQDTRRLAELVAVAEPLARRPRRELILARLVAKGADLSSAASLANDDRDALLARGVAARAITFTSAAPGEDLVRIASEQDVDLLLVDGPADLDDPVLETVLARAPCDVAVHVGRGEPARDGPVLVLFAGGDHDWTAVEVGAWIAGANGVPLRLAGPAEGAERDASRALASASLAVQRVIGIAAEPVLVPPSAPDVLAAAEEAAVVVIGLPERWRRDSLGAVRSALAQNARPPALLVRRGLRPGGLAPPESLTRFTWTLGPAP